MKSIKYLVVLVCIMSASFITEAKGQVYSNGALFYAWSEGNPDNPDGTVCVCRFDWNRAYIIMSKRGTVRNNLAKSMDYYDNLDENTVKKLALLNYGYYEIDNNVPSDSRTVYSDEWFFHNNCNDREFFAVSKDKSSLIRFTMDQYRKQMKTKTYFIRIDKEDILPKVDYDWLND